MLYKEEWDPTPPKLPKQPALVIPAIHGVRAFSGARNPLTRSNTARRVSMTFTTPHLDGDRQVFVFESDLESVVALEALLAPNFYHIEVQLPPVEYLSPSTRRMRSHHYDHRITFRDGHRRAIFARNASSLARHETREEVRALVRATPPNFADDVVIVSSTDYSRARRDNLRRVWLSSQVEDAEAERHVLEAIECRRCHLVDDLVRQCDLARPRAMDAILRLVGRGMLEANWDQLINKLSKVWLPR